MTLKAYYKRLANSYYGHIRHVDDEGRPLCKERGHRITDKTSVAPEWQLSTDEPTCKICLKMARLQADAVTP